MKHIFLVFALLAACVRALAEVPLAEDKTLLFYGNGMVERLLESGHMEAEVQLAHADKNLHVRSLAWTGDEVGRRARPEGYVEHLKTLLAQWPAKVVVLGYGMNESFAGQAGLKDFRAQYELLLREIKRLHPQATLALLSPIAGEMTSGAMPMWPRIPPSLPTSRKRTTRRSWTSSPRARRPTPRARRR